MHKTTYIHSQNSSGEQYRNPEVFRILGKTKHKIIEVCGILRENSAQNHRSVQNSMGGTMHTDQHRNREGDFLTGWERFTA